MKSILEDQVFSGLGLGVSLGAIGGAILAWPFSIFGALMGSILAAPVGLMIGIICGKKHWPFECVAIASSGQFGGAMFLGMVFYKMSMDAAFVGQIIGAFIGIYFASKYYSSIRKPGHCFNCGYNLTGLTEPRCPECGTPFDPKLLEKLKPNGLNKENQKGNGV